MNANSISKISFDDSNSSKSEFENPSFKPDQQNCKEQDTFIYAMM